MIHIDGYSLFYKNRKTVREGVAPLIVSSLSQYCGKSTTMINDIRYMNVAWKKPRGRPQNSWLRHIDASCWEVLGMGREPALELAIE